MVGNKAQKAVAAALTGMMVLGSAAPAFAGVYTVDTDDDNIADAGWYRVNGDHTESYQLFTAETEPTQTINGGTIVAGKDRYDTMFDSINYNVTDGKYAGIKEVVLASGESQADSLVAAGVAGMLNNKAGAPVITTPKAALGTQAERAIKWFAEQSGVAYNKFTVYIVGGNAAVSDDVESAITSIKDAKGNAITVKRLAGEDRVATSLEAAKIGDTAAGWLDDAIKATSKKSVYIANGKAWPDALSVSSLAYLLKTPIMLTDADGMLSADQLAYLKKLDGSVTFKVVGGPALPSVDQLYNEGFNKAKVAYLGGADRYETSAAVIEDFSLNCTAPLEVIAVASGTEAHWADALIGGAFVGANDGVLALVDGVDEVTALKAAYKAQKVSQGLTGTAVAEAPAKKSFIMGGTASIDDTFADKLNANFPATL